MRDISLYESGIHDYNRLLAGKNVFITTAARGIGKSIAVVFAHQGAVVYFAGRNEAYVRQTESELQLVEPRCRGYVCDLANAEQTEQVANKVLQDSDGIDVLVPSVGVNCHCNVEEFSDEDLFRLLETNYISGLRFARKFVPAMRKRGGGSIISISSIHSIMTQPGNLLYAGTKGAMNAAARAMAIDYACDNIRVNTICPGVVMSDIMLDDVDSKGGDKEKAQHVDFIRKLQPLEPVLMPDIANVALFLASDMSRGITGQSIMVDGGTSVMEHDFAMIYG